MTLRRAIFLDRDGVLNRNCYYPDTGAYESPRTAEELVLTPGLTPALAQLASAGYLLFLVSNQPNVAKGKCTEDELRRIHLRLAAMLAIGGIYLEEAYYCLHHPVHTGACVCRKPSPYFLLRAAEEYRLDLNASWMIGDRVTDVACGHAAHTKTAWIDNGEGHQCDTADVIAGNVPDAVVQILEAKA